MPDFTGFQNLFEPFQAAVGIIQHDAIKLATLRFIQVAARHVSR